jgi:alpha-D-xyloside xylohydrolase
VKHETAVSNLLKFLAFGFFATVPLHAQQMTVSRGDVTVMVEPYADNVVRVSISILKDKATSVPGYGISAGARETGWTRLSSTGGDVLRSLRMSVTVVPQQTKNVPMGTQADIAKFFGGSTPGVGISIRNADGSPLLQMSGWQMSVPNHKDGNAGILNDRRDGDDPFYEVGASFAISKDEHFYGLG